MFKKTKQNLVAIHPIFFVLGNILKLDKQWQKKYIFLILLFLSEKQNCIRFFCAIKDQESENSRYIVILYLIWQKWTQFCFSLRHKVIKEINKTERTEQKGLEPKYLEQVWWGVVEEFPCEESAELENALKPKKFFRFPSF